MLSRTSSGSVKMARGPADQRIGTLDCFRGLAILAVLGFHYSYRWTPLYDKNIDLNHFPHTFRLFGFGYLGVHFFFIISGFVIFMTLEKCGSGFEFAVRRLARLYPTYIVCMTATFLVLLLFENPLFYPSVADYVSGLTMNSYDLGYQYVDGAYWSLAVEVKFYFWIAVLYFGFPKRFLSVWIAFCAVAVLLHFFLPRYAVYVAADYLPFFSAGIGVFMQYSRHVRDRRGLAFLALAAFLYAVLWRDAHWVVHILVFAMIVVFELFVLGKLNWLNRTGLAFIGLVSYPLYLVHQNVGISLINELAIRYPQLAYFWPVLAAVGMIGIASIVHKFVEIPSHKIVRAVFARNTAQSKKLGGAQIG